VLEVRRRQVGAKGVAESGVFVPVANMRRRHPIRTADQIEQAPQPALHVIDRSAAFGTFGERDGFSAITLADFENASRDVIQSFVLPWDAFA